MEVILFFAALARASTGILNVCGGDPYTEAYNRGLGPVFSTYVEVILYFSIENKVADSILHVCGGDPSSSNVLCAMSSYSPHMLRVLLSLSAQINSL